MRVGLATASLFGVFAGTCSTRRCRLPVTGSIPASTRTRRAPLGRTSITPVAAQDAAIPSPHGHHLTFVGPKMGPAGVGKAVDVLMKYENRLVRGGFGTARPKGFEPLTF